MKTGIQLIVEEREEHLLREGWTAAHDAQHNRGELSAAASVYAAVASCAQRGGLVRGTLDGGPPDGWPFDFVWWKPSDDPVRTLVKAGALIAAEIDRIQRKRSMEEAAEIKNGRGLADS